EHEELDESNDLAGEQEENGDDTDDTEEQRSEQALQVGNQARRTERHGGCRDDQVGHRSDSGGYGGWRLGGRVRLSWQIGGVAVAGLLGARWAGLWPRRTTSRAVARRSSGRSSSGRPGRR